MRKPTSFLVLSLIILISLISPSSTYAASSSQEKIAQTVNNFYKSLNTQDKDLYLKSITNSSNPEFLYAAEHLESTQISYTIENIEKIEETKYIAYIHVEEKGTSYPLFPYEVQLEEDGQWKINTNSFLVIPKAKSTKVHSDQIFSENDLFIVQKIENTNEELAARASLSYSFNQYSTDIWVAGSATVYVYPSANVPYVEVTIIGQSSQYPTYIETQFVDTNPPFPTGINYVTFSVSYGYYKFLAVPGSSVTGYYTVHY